MLTGETLLITKARTEGIIFGKMPAEQLLVCAEFYLNEIKLHTGLNLPTGESFSRLKVLLAEKLRDDFYFFTNPLVMLAIKKYSATLTTGQNKSYGRDISIADFETLINVYQPEISAATEEVNLLMDQNADLKLLSEEEKENIIRSNIEQNYQTGNFDACTFACFNQLQKDGIIQEVSLFRRGWHSIQRLKSKYAALVAQNLPKGEEDTKTILSGRNAKEKLLLLQEIEDEAKADIACQFLQWSKEQKAQNIYKPEK